MIVKILKILSDSGRRTGWDMRYINNITVDRAIVGRVERNWQK